MSSTSLARILKSLRITGELSKAVRLLYRSTVCPGARTYALLLQERVNRREAKLGKRIHARGARGLHRVQLRVYEYIATKLLIFYCKIGEVDIARNLFDGMPHRSVLSWNAVISGCAPGVMDDKNFRII